MHISAAFVAVVAALSTTVSARRYECDKDNYAKVARQILNPAYFCRFYLSHKRYNSPLPDFGPKQLTNLCHCFIQNSPNARGPRKVAGEVPAKFKVCNIQHVRAIRNQYKFPVAFSKFYLAGPRFMSPLPSIPRVEAVKVAARCVIDGFGLSSSSATPTRTSSSRRSSSRRTTTTSLVVNPTNTATTTTSPATTPATTTTATPSFTNDIQSSIFSSLSSSAASSASSSSTSSAPLEASSSSSSTSSAQATTEAAASITSSASSSSASSASSSSSSSSSSAGA